jgi:hypothetical protein
MKNRTVIWTHELSMSARIIAAERAPQPDREANAKDIRDRARELADYCMIGTPLTACGVECVQALRSRLSDPYVTFVGRDPFERAWAEAWAVAAPDSAAA